MPAIRTSKSREPSRWSWVMSIRWTITAATVAGALLIGATALFFVPRLLARAAAAAFVSIADDGRWGAAD
jgi:hypothetical protein